MRTSIAVIVALGTFQGSLAVPNSSPTNLGTLPGDDKPCSTPVATITTTELAVHCLPVCIVPTSSCSSGEPTGPTPNPPVTNTVAPSGACTATLEVFDNPGCDNCPTCTSAQGGVRARQTSLPGEHWCSPTATVVTTISPQSTEICACPDVRTTCSPGQPTVPPLPTTTLTEGCVESIIAGPANCFNICPTCVNWS